MITNINIRVATVEDADVILTLVNKNASQGLMLTKTPYKIYTTIQNFFVAEEEGQIVGCAALSTLWKDLAEVCSLAVADGHMGKGIGRKLVNACVDKARALKLPKVMALTYQDKFFEKMGFTQVDKDLFPRKIWRECLECPKLEECDEFAYMLQLN